MSPLLATWNLGRFLQTLCEFEVLPGSHWIHSRFRPSSITMDAELMDVEHSDQSNGHIFDFQVTEPRDRPGAPYSQDLWRSLDDVVMGGVSQSFWRVENGAGQFRGQVSTANSGGFASVRTRTLTPALDLSCYQGLELRVKGDGQRYKFLLRDREGWDSVAFAASFDTPVGVWTTVQIPLARLVPVLRARTLRDYRPLNPATVRSLQLMLSKFEYDGELNPHFQAGDFALSVAWIGGY